MIKSEENPALTAASLLPFTPAPVGSSLFRGQVSPVSAFSSYLHPALRPPHP